MDTLTKGRRIDSPQGVIEQEGRSSEWGTSAGGETLSLRSTFCQLGFRRLLEAAMHGACWQEKAPVALSMFAGIAQLVEHNLAKVGVAGSSPVSRFVLLGPSVTLFAGSSFSARVAKPVDARDLKSLGINSHAGSIPAPSIEPDRSHAAILSAQVHNPPDAA